MTTDLIGHLVNLKVLSDYKQSNLDSIGIFWALIKEGKNPNRLRAEPLDLDPEEVLNPTEPTDEEIKSSKNQKEFNESGDYMEDYLEWIYSEIEGLYIMQTPPEVLKLESVYEDHIRGSRWLIDFIKIDRHDFKFYIEILGARHPKEFFSRIKQYEESGRRKSKQIDSTINKRTESKMDENNPYPRIFTGLTGYRIFEEYCKNTPIRHVDLSYLYFKLKGKYIDKYCGNDEFRVWYNETYKENFGSKLKSQGTDTIIRRKKLRDIIVKYKDLEKDR